MKKIRFGMIVLWMLLCSVTTASAQVSIGIGLPNVSIGINLPLYPTLVPVPGYPVYYAPQVDANYFFYDGMYWVFYNDYWYASSWYNGPWAIVQPEYVPLFILRIPVHYYRRPPMYFHGWRSNAPPHWGEHWGPGWEQHRRGWDRWNRHYVPARAPLPAYQRRYSGDRYPHVQQQQTLRSRNYRYQPHDAIVRQHLDNKQLPHLLSGEDRKQLRQEVQGNRRSSVQRHPSRSDRPGLTHSRHIVEAKGIKGQPRSSPLHSSEALHHNNEVLLHSSVVRHHSSRCSTREQNSVCSSLQGRTARNKDHRSPDRATGKDRRRMSNEARNTINKVELSIRPETRHSRAGGFDEFSLSPEHLFSAVSPYAKTCPDPLKNPWEIHEKTGKMIHANYPKGRCRVSIL